MNSTFHPSVLVLCTGNSCRSHMAEGFLRHICGDKATIYSGNLIVLLIILGDCYKKLTFLQLGQSLPDLS